MCGIAVLSHFNLIGLLTAPSYSGRMMPSATATRTTKAVTRIASQRCDASPQHHRLAHQATTYLDGRGRRAAPVAATYALDDVPQFG